MKAHQRIIRERMENDSDGQGVMWLHPARPDLSHAQIRRIDYATASTVILKYEWIGTMPLPKSCRYMYGIYFDGVLGGAVVYVEPSTRQFNRDYPRRILQLNRGAVEHWTPKNTSSRLIGRSFGMLKQEGILAVIAYCTREAGEVGTIYQACNFIYTGETLPAKAYYLDKHWVSERTLSDKIKWARNRGDRWRAKFENLPMKLLEGKYRYLYLLGNKTENKIFMARFGYQALPYPKREVEND